MAFLKNVWMWLWKHKKISAALLVVLLILIVIFRPKPAPPVPTYTVSSQNLAQTVSVSGTINALNTVNLTFPIGGTLSYVGVTKGESVKAYQTIAELDESTAQKNLQAALIAYDEQRNTFDQTISNNNNIGDPNNALNDTMKRMLEDNQDDLNKTVNSVELQSVAEQQSVLTTPIAGIVTRVDAPVAGVTALAGTTTYTVTDPSSMVFDMDVDEADVGSVKLGQIAQINLDAYPNTTLSLPVSNIDFTSHTTTNGGNAFTVEVKLQNNTNDMYRVGMTGNADIITAQKNNVLTIPLSSLDQNNDVYVETGKNKFTLRKVSIGLQSDTDAQVLSGLQAGDKIAVDPQSVAKSSIQ